LGLQDKLAKKIANENSMNYSSNFLTQKVNRTIEKNAKALVLTDDEKKLIAGKEKERSRALGQDIFYPNYYENLEKTLNIDLPLASFKGVSFLNKSPNEISVTFNDSTNNIAYIHIPGTNQAYVRAQLCKQDGPMTVCENGKKVIKEYKKGDVVIDSETIFHYVPTMIKDKNGNPTLVQQVGVDGKPLYEYRPVGLEDTYSQTAGNLLSKGADTILGIASLGLLSSGRDTKSRIKREFGLDDYEHVVKRYKDIKVLAVATNENGERSVATLHDGKAVNHSVLGREEVKVVDAPEPMNVNKDLLGIRADKDSNGAEIKFVFDEKGNLKDDGNLCTIEAKNSSKDFYGYGRYVSCDNFKIGQLQLFAKVGVITGEGSVLNHSGISSARDGDIFFKQNLYYTNPANPNEKLPMFKNDGSFKDLSADFLKYCRDNGIQLTAKDIANLVYNFQNNFSAAVSVEIEKPKDIQEFDGSNISRTKYQLQSINAPMVVRPGKAVENDVSLKEDLLTLRANTIAASAASRTTPDFSNLKELNTQVTNIKNYKNLSAERKAKPVSAAFGLLGKPNTDFKPTGAELLKASAERRQHV
ncbi:MAG: hypothetical protein SFV53_03345, partial [Rickettsiales bacterium]|nr:hypothetical protein [Rickettsiales bacterium]